MLLTRREMEQQLTEVFPPPQAARLVDVLDSFREAEMVRAAETRELRQGLTSLTKEVRKLAQAQARTEQRLEELAQAQARTEQRLEELAQAQARTEQRLEELAAAQEELVAAQTRTEQRLEELVAAQEELAAAQTRTEETLARLIASHELLVQTVNKMGDLLGDTRGRLLELYYPAKAYAYFGSLLRRVQVISLQTLEEDLLAHLSEQAFRDLILLDLLLKGRPRKLPRKLKEAPEVWLAVEISSVVDRHDVERAQRRAAALRQAGYRAIPTVIGEETTAGAEEAARAGNVLILKDGRPYLWDEALAAALEE